MRWEGKRVLIVGLGKSGLAAVRFLVQRGAVVSATDERVAGEFADVTFAEVMLTRSNVQSRAYSVKGSGEDAHPSRVSLHYARHKAISKTDVTTSIGESSGKS